MSVEFLLQLCAQHGIKLTLSSDGSDRLMVDAPKGSLTPSLREALTANKPQLIAALKAQAESDTVTEIRPAPVTPTNGTHYEFDSSRTPAVSSVVTQTEARNALPSQFERAGTEVRNLLEGRRYDVKVIEESDAATRQVVETELLSALSHRGTEEHKRAREAFLEHGYFDEATSALRTADSPAERAAAARKLGAVGSRLGTQHVVAALFDTAPEVRRSAVEALGEIGDPAAVAPLNDLVARETSRQVPPAMVRQAIDSITRLEPVQRRAVASQGVDSAQVVNSNLPPVAETFLRVPVAEEVTNELAGEEARLRAEEERLLQAVEELERRRMEAEAARKQAEQEARAKAELEAKVRAEVEARRAAEEEARRRAEEEAARRAAEEEAQMRAEQEERAQAEAAARHRAEEEARFRIEAENLRNAAEELSRKRAAAEAANK